MLEEIKKCPFCGGNAGVFEDEFEGNKIYMVACEQCAISTAAYEHDQSAINDWNKRVNDKS